MAQIKHVVLIDDLDGSPATQTVLFSLDGVEYEIDLNDAHAEALRDSFAEWIGNARKISGRKRSPARRQGGGSAAQLPSAVDTAKIREWARRNGYTVSDRGRIPSSVREAYELAN